MCLPLWKATGESRDFVAWYPDRSDSRPDSLLNESKLDTQAFLNMERKVRRKWIII